MKAPNRAGDVCPVLIGQQLPEIVLTSPDNASFNLNEACTRKPTILVFYRGGWCPFCNKQLGGLQSAEPELAKLGYQVIAVSPDRPELLKKSTEKQRLKYRLLSDSSMAAAMSLGIAFKVDDTTVIKYKTEYGIDIEGDSGEKHHLLPVPSVFVVGEDGVIKFSYVNPNYKVRMDSGLLLEAAKAAKREPAESKP